MHLNGNEILERDRWLRYEVATFKTKINICEGAVRSGKSVANCKAFADRIIASDYEGEGLFLACAVSESMAKALIGESSGYGIFYIFNSLRKYGCRADYRKYKDQDALRIEVAKNGRKYIRWVLFVGGSKARCEEAIRGLTIQGASIEELNLMTPEFYLEVNRRMIVSKDPFIYATMNPSMSKHWVYRDIIDNPQMAKYMTYCHATLIDNPALTAKQIEEIKDQYDKDSVQYKGYILGERMNPSGAIYHIHDYNIIDSFDPGDYRHYVVVCDQGESISATAMTLGACRYDFTKGLCTYDIIKEYHHINSESTGAGRKMYEDYANDLAEFVLESARMMERDPDEVIIDQDPEFYAQVCIAFRKKGLDEYAVKFPYKLEIKDRVKMGVALMHKGQLRFHKDCVHTIEDFKNAQYDEKAIQKRGEFIRAKTYTEGFGHLDMIDSVEYGFTRYQSDLLDETIE